MQKKQKVRTMPSKSTEFIYQVKITLRGSKPPIWRRLLLPNTISLYQLHQIIQIAMGWNDSHLHQFIINEKYFGVPSPDDWRPVKDERRYTLNQVAPSQKSRFIYEYDFGDSWEHEILIEKIQPLELGVKYPICIKGKRACPPEDIGGIWGYMEFSEAMSNPNHSKHDSYREWWSGDFDPEDFDIEDINQALQEIR
jgi:hypothetical protein